MALTGKNVVCEFDFMVMNFIISKFQLRNYIYAAVAGKVSSCVIFYVKGFHAKHNENQLNYYRPSMGFDKGT